MSKDSLTVTPRIVCLGNLTVDDVVLPDGQTEMGHCGSDAIYSGFGARLWLDEVGMVAPMGTDFPKTHMDHLAKLGIDLSGFPPRPVPSIRCWVLYEHDGRRNIILRSQPEDFLTLSPTMQDIPPSWLQAEGFHVAAMELESQEDLMSSLSPLAGIVSLDPRIEYIAGNEKRLLDMISKSDIFLPSHVEAEALFGHTDHRRAARQFAETGCPLVVITEGELGSLVYERATDRFWQIPAHPTRVVDPTGAGDAYCGGFLAEFLISRDPVRAGIAGAVSSSFCIEDFEPFHLGHTNRQDARRRFEWLAPRVQIVS